MVTNEERFRQTWNAYQRFSAALIRIAGTLCRHQRESDSAKRCADQPGCAGLETSWCASCVARAALDAEGVAFPTDTTA